ncbi:DUF2797 domain-containing protein [Halogranum rubrum]|uniref:DUF2797 domain-containing protein n=1 Tax=Halogranum salarium B-1 TaxID=1210908 RepID=J3A7M0_9EURY|nr:DUF2797 domain-containing protein [Halogranum salarium]EJN61618.1 hypothetical protein HSB1_06590 [Halogranum salarium B-1]
MQIVGYDTSAEAGLLLSDGDELDYVSLDAGTELAYTLGERHCAGTIHEDTHLACDADRAPYCADHQYTWVCARCTGTCLKDEMDCYDDHAVYLAAFAPDVFKVGVTKRWRLDTRLREQGADRAAHIRTVENGRIAREIEAGIADADDVTDRVRVPTKRRGLHQRVDDEAWTDFLAEFDPIETFTFDYDLQLTDRPMAETIATGTVRGTKGRLLVLDHAGSTYAVDVRDLVGYEVTEGRTERDVQSSLGAFG